MKTMVKTKVKYPAFICDTCGTHYGKWWQVNAYHPAHHCATYHMGECNLCKATNVPVTEPRDYGHLIDEWEEIQRKM